VPVAQAFEITRRAPHGHVRAVAMAMERLGLAGLISSQQCCEGDPPFCDDSSCIVAPHMKLATTRWWHTMTLADDFGVPMPMRTTFHAYSLMLAAACGSWCTRAIPPIAAPSRPQCTSCAKPSVLSAGSWLGIGIWFPRRLSARGAMPTALVDRGAQERIDPCVARAVASSDELAGLPM